MCVTMPGCAAVILKVLLDLVSFEMVISKTEALAIFSVIPVF